jgi:hypothetical protein
MMRLRITIVVGPLVAVLASGLEGELPPPWLVVVVAAFSVAHALLPDSQLGTTAALLVLGWWALGPVAALPASLLLAAAALVAAHVAAVVAAYGPAGLPVDPALLRTWLRRGLLSLLAAPLVWVVVAAIDDQPEPVGIWVAALLAATAGAVVASVAFGIDSGEPA